jgi:hypothetical protein
MFIAKLNSRLGVGAQPLRAGPLPPRLRVGEAPRQVPAEPPQRHLSDRQAHVAALDLGAAVAARGLRDGRRGGGGAVLAVCSVCFGGGGVVAVCGSGCGASCAAGAGYAGFALRLQLFVLEQLADGAVGGGERCVGFADGVGEGVAEDCLGGAGVLFGVWVRVLIAGLGF